LQLAVGSLQFAVCSKRKEQLPDFRYQEKQRQKEQKQLAVGSMK